MRSAVRDWNLFVEIVKSANSIDDWTFRERAANMAGKGSTIPVFDGEDSIWKNAWTHEINYEKYFVERTCVYLEGSRILKDWKRNKLLYTFENKKLVEMKNVLFCQWSEI